MGGTTLHVDIVAQWFEILLLCYYGRQWDFIWCNDTEDRYTRFKIRLTIM